MIRNLIPLLEILTYVYCLAALYGQRVKYNIYTVIFIVLEMILMLGINDYGLPAYLISISYVLLFIYCLLNYKLTIKETLVNLLISVVIVGLVQLVTYFVLVTIGVNDSINNVAYEIIIMSVSIFIIGLFGSKIKLNSLAEFINKNKWLQGAVSVFIIIVFGSRIWKMKANSYLDGQDFIFTVYFFGILLMLLIEWQKTKSDAEKKKIQLELNRYYYDTYKELIASIRDKQHDFKNHMNAIRGMLYTAESFEELKGQEEKYLNNILMEIQDTTLITKVENPIIAGFLSVRIREAESLGIEVEYDCAFLDRDIKVPEYLLIEMMGILLDNAVEAIHNLDVKKIEIFMRIVDQRLSFSVSNTYNSEGQNNVTLFFERGYSNKGSNRGIGLTKLKKMVNKFNGEIILSENKINTADALKIGFVLPI